MAATIYGDKLRFMYYARGSLFETKYWLNRASTRNLISSEQVETHVAQLSGLTRQLNAFIRSLKVQSGKESGYSVREIATEYNVTSDFAQETADEFITDAELHWIETIS